MDRGKGFKPTGWTVLFLMIPSMFIMMGGAVVAPALPAIGQAFPDASQLMVSLVITIPGTAIAVTGFGLGYLADRIGKVRLLVLSALLLGVSGSAGYFLESLPAIVVSRFFLGMSIGGFTVSTTALITDYYEGDARLRIIGLQSASMGIGVLILEVLGGFLADIGWRVSFLPYLIGIPMAIGMALTMREPAAPSPVADTAESEDVGINLKSVAACYAIACLGLLLAYVLPTMLPYCMNEIGMSGLAIGVLIGWFGVCMAISSMLYRRISGRLGRFQILTLAFGVTGIGYCLMFDTSSLSMMVLSLALIGFGLGMVTPAVVDWLALLSNPGNSGRIMGGYSSVLNFGPLLSAVLATSVLSMVPGYGAMFSIIGLLALVLCLICALPMAKNLISKRGA
ncbi:MAG: MFS transporter [Candidatus Methanomethylophilaceae archaeon]|nr:MFS transporter [Candidatus Methanomethylophilaceae archaeon]